MDGPRDGGGGGGGGVVSVGSSNGSILTVSKEDNLVLSSEVSSSSGTNEYELELCLGLSLSCGGAPAPKSSHRSQYARILTAEDLPSVVAKPPSSVTQANVVPCGSKRSAESSPPPRSGVSQFVGWPPVRPYRMNSLVNQGKLPMAEDCNSTISKSKSKSMVLEKTDSRNVRTWKRMPKNLYL